MSEAALRQDVSVLTAKLRTEHVVYFPIRHHSPACAAHLDRLIGSLQPAHVLIEGPASFDAWIPQLLDSRCVAPVALYTTYTEPRQAADDPATPAAVAAEPARASAFYPFCDHSPELVALRRGAAVGATLNFIDLEYDEMVRVDRAHARTFFAGPRSLASDPHLLHSEYIRSLARKLGCRDHDELWDHLFEARSVDEDSGTFIETLAAYCALSRRSYGADALEADGTLAREARMAARIRTTLATATGPVLVVTGGFHTAALPFFVESDQQDASPPPAPSGANTGTWLIRYSFDRLDRFCGYGAGMPAPAYYDAQWRAVVPTGDEEPATRMVDACTRLLIALARASRDQKLSQVLSTADSVAALTQARNLAALRGHPWPLRCDLIDAVQSCFLKDATEPNDPLMALAQLVLTGERIGQTPPGATVPPIVADFNAQANTLGIELSSRSRPLNLDLYRNRRDRQRSRWLHQLDFLGVPFGHFEAGPDFVHGHGLTLMQERWSVRWSPMVESAIIEAAVLGESVRTAAVARLKQRIAALQAEGESRNARAAAELLTQACQLGLHDQLDAIFMTIRAQASEDPSLASVVGAATRLELLMTSREPLEAGDLTEVPALLQTTYHRACRLIPDAAVCPDEAVRETLDALASLRELVAGVEDRTDETHLDPAHFRDAIHRILSGRRAQAQPALIGAAAGILYADGALDEEGIRATVVGYLHGTVHDVKSTCDVLRGLMAVSREAVWQVRGLLDALGERLTAWSEEDFRRALPGLRLAFSGLTPRETLRVAGAVTTALDGMSVGALVTARFDEDDLEAGIAVETEVAAALVRDGLGNLES